MAGVGALLLLVVKDHRSPALAYAWVLAYGLGGGAANKLGNALVAWGAILVSGAYALLHRHVVACCYVVPPLGFAAGAFLSAQVCCALAVTRGVFYVALPVWVYGFFLLISSITLRHQGKDFNMEASDGMCAPKELCAATWCSCLELSGWLWTFVGLCAGLFFGINAIWGRMLFCGLLIVMGVINLSRGFRVGKQVSDHADEELNEKQKAAENAEFARGVRLRIFGMVVINLAVWFAVGGVETAIARALLACLGSLVAIASGCFYLVWQKQIRARAPPPPPVPPVASDLCGNPAPRHRRDVVSLVDFHKGRTAAGGDASASRSAARATGRTGPAPGPGPGAGSPGAPAEGDAPRRRRRDGRGRDVAQGRARHEGRRPPPRAPAHGRLRQRRRADGRAQEADRLPDASRGGVARRDAGADANNADQAGAPRHRARRLQRRPDDPRAGPRRAHPRDRVAARFSAPGMRLAIKL